MRTTPTAGPEAVKPIIVQVLRIRGCLDPDVTFKVCALIEDFQRQGQVHFMLHLEACTYALNDRHLNALAMRAQRLKEYGGGLLIVAAPVHIRHTLALAGYADKFRHFDTEQAALDHFAGKR